MPPTNPRLPEEDRRPPGRPVAPDKEAPKADHRRHAEEVLVFEDYKQKPPNYQDLNDEANP